MNAIALYLWIAFVIVMFTAVTQSWVQLVF